MCHHHQSTQHQRANTSSSIGRRRRRRLLSPSPSLLLLLLSSGQRSANNLHTHTHTHSPTYALVLTDAQRTQASIQIGTGELWPSRRAPAFISCVCVCVSFGCPEYTTHTHPHTCIVFYGQLFVIYRPMPMPRSRLITNQKMK